MNRKLVFLAVASLVTLAAVASAQTLPAGVQKMTSMGGITEYDFPNGLKVLLYPDAAEPKITVNVTYLVGSRHEGYGETGMAHLLEHLDFIETTTGRHIKDEITAHTSSWNGTTSEDRTNYFETFSATDENLKWALSLETDRMVNVKFTKQILDTEMTVVRNELERGENNPPSILGERVAATAYIWHNYGKSTIGSKEDLENVPYTRPEAFYHKFYQPDNAVLVITGRIDESKTLQFVADSMGAAAPAHAQAGTDIHHRAAAGWRTFRGAAARGFGTERHGRLPRGSGRPSRFRRPAGAGGHHERQQRRTRRTRRRSRGPWQRGRPE